MLRRSRAGAAFQAALTRGLPVQKMVCIRYGHKQAISWIGLITFPFKKHPPLSALRFGKGLTLSLPKPPLGSASPVCRNY